MEKPDPFSRVLPLPFRLEGHLILGIWFWALNLHGFSRMNIDIFALIRYPIRPDPDVREPQLHISVYRLAAILSTLWIASLLLFWSLTWGDAEAVIGNQWIPNSLFVLMLVATFGYRIPVWKQLYGSDRREGVLRLWSGLKRVALGGIAGPKPEKFGDVLLADAMTSYAKPISEVFVTLCMFVKMGSTTAKPDRLCGHELVVPLAMAWPFAIRLRQCLTEGQTLNALKYSTAFPVIILATLARGDNSDLHTLKNCAAIVNSLYSFWWDVTRDWDLTLLLRPSERHPRPYGLRQPRVFPVWAYYAVMVFDLVLRFTWNWKLSLALVNLDGLEGGIAILEVLELTRRWVWLFFRVETEWLRLNTTGGMIAL